MKGLCLWEDSPSSAFSLNSQREINRRHRKHCSTSGKAWIQSNSTFVFSFKSESKGNWIIWEKPNKNGFDAAVTIPADGGVHTKWEEQSDANNCISLRSTSGSHTFGLLSYGCQPSSGCSSSFNEPYTQWQSNQSRLSFLIWVPRLLRLCATPNSSGKTEVIDLSNIVILS